MEKFWIGYSIAVALAAFGLVAEDFSDGSADLWPLIVLALVASLVPIGAIFFPHWAQRLVQWLRRKP